MIYKNGDQVTFRRQLLIDGIIYHAGTRAMVAWPASVGYYTVMVFDNGYFEAVHARDLVPIPALTLLAEASE